jgi:hypothetical protein
MPREIPLADFPPNSVFLASAASTGVNLVLVSQTQPVISFDDRLCSVTISAEVARQRETNFNFRTFL